MRCFLFILLFSLSFRAFADVIFTSERCNRVTYGLRTVNGDPSRYKQCGPSGRVWIVPCAPQMTFDPEDRVCKERPDPKVMKPMRKYEVPKTIITTPPPVPASYPVSAEVTPGSFPAASPPASHAAAPEEFVFSTIRPKSRKPKARTRTKTRKTTVAMTSMPLTATPLPTSTAFPTLETEQTTPKIVIFASKKGLRDRSGERATSREAYPSPAFTRPGRIRTTTPIPVTHATRFVAGIQKITLPPKETQGMPHTLAPYEKMERRVENFGGEELTTMTPEYTVRYNGKTMTENEFLNQLLHIVQHQKSVSERQQQDKFDRMEQERLKQEKEERAKELERRRQLEEAERARQAELERQAAIYAEQERMAMERERELERIRQEERKREMERIRQEEVAMEIARMRELERLQMERQQKNEKVRQELEAARKQKIMEEERQRKIQEQMMEMERIREEQEEARQRELRRLEEEREREMQRVRQEEEERQQQIEKLRKQEEERRRKKLEREEKERNKAIQEEQRKQKILEKEMEQRRQELVEEERKRKMMEKEMEDRQKAIYEEERRRKAEEERRKEKEMEERRQVQEQMKKATEERTRLEAMEREREMMMQIIDSERERAELERVEFPVTTPVTTIKPIYRPMTEYQPPDVEPHMIRFTTQSPEWATLPPKWQPEWNTVTVEEETPGVPRVPVVPVAQRGCDVSGECELKYDHDSFCAHPNNPSMYLQCAPLYGRLGRWTERHCPDTLVFLVSVGRCEKGEGGRRPYDPDNRVVIPRLPSETSFVEWTGNRVIDHQVPISPPRVYPPVPETHQPQIYNTIDEFPKDLLPRIPEVSPADTYAQQYQNHIHGSVISGGSHQVRPAAPAPSPTIAPIPIVPSSYQIIRGQIPAQTNSITKSEIDLSHIHPLFPRVQPDFLSRILPSLNLKLHDENSTAPQSLGSVVKPVIKKIALNQTEQFLDRLLADQVQDKDLRKELIDRLKSSNMVPAVADSTPKPMQSS